MKKLIIAFIILIGFAQCRKHDASPDYVEKVLYTGDSVRYNFDSLPAPLPAAPADYKDYFKVVHVYTNKTMIVDFTHILDRGMSATFRSFIRYNNGTYDLKGWYRQQIVNGYVIPANREVAVYHTVPYNGPTGPVD